MDVVRRIGLSVVYEPANEELHTLDIVLVHGLFGHPENTWSAKKVATSDEAEHSAEPARKKPRLGKTEAPRAFWPREFLPTKFPHARIMTWGYDVSIKQFLASSSDATIIHHSETLLGDLSAMRCGDIHERKPVIFIAHSLGGIVVKDALQLSADETTHLHKIVTATIGVIFLGTPHQGSKVASLGKLAFNILKVLQPNPNTKILEGLEINSEILERISRRFGQLLATGQIRVHSFREQLDTNGVMIVHPFSSVIGYFNETRSSLYADHRGMAKFTSSKDVNFERVTAVLEQWMNPSNNRRIHNSAAFNQKADPLPDGLIFGDQYQVCLRSLDSAQAKRRFHEVDNAYGHTYDWIFSTEVNFQEWLRGTIPNPVYWIQGKPGSGKSTAMKFAMVHQHTQDMLQHYRAETWIVGGYFFHDRGSSIQKSVRGLLGELLHRILANRKDLFHLVLPTFHSLLHRMRSNEPATDSWTFQDLIDSVSSVGSKVTRNLNICFFVDALDEEEGDHKNLLLVINTLARLASNTHFLVRLCVAGRPENLFKAALGDCPTFIIQEHTKHDIESYARGRLRDESKILMLDESQEELTHLITDVINRAQGVFLWVRLVVDETAEGICQGDTVRELRDDLSSIPTELEGLYTRALRRRRRTSDRPELTTRNEAYVMFQMVGSAQEPLSLYHLLRASLFLTTGKDPLPELEKLSIDQMLLRFNARSFGLLEVIEGTRTRLNPIAIDPVAFGPSRPLNLDWNSNVQFIHQTAKEYVNSEIGSTIIREEIPENLQGGGPMIFVRYCCELLKNFSGDHLDLNAQDFILDNFA
ncbi:MAG: hypothetical protein M1821_003398 [Bathelium mastoideum]|nr:MAG: hypothetical protein M1821_003398 [Bathelium mastoideum]